MNIASIQCGLSFLKGYLADKTHYNQQAYVRLSDCFIETFLSGKQWEDVEDGVSIQSFADDKPIHIFGVLQCIEAVLNDDRAIPLMNMETKAALLLFFDDKVYDLRKASLASEGASMREIMDICDEQAEEGNCILEMKNIISSEEKVELRLISGELLFGVLSFMYFDMYY